MKPSKIISLSAVCTAFAGGCVALGNIIPMLDYTMFLVASLFVMTPIMAGSYKGGLLCGIASVLVGLIMAPNFVTVVPYVVFFAPYSVLLCFLEDNKRKFGVVLKVAVKAVFFIVCEIVLWKYANFFADFDSLGLPIWALLGIGMVVLFVFDFLMKRIRWQLGYQLWRIFKMGGSN